MFKEGYSVYTMICSTPTSHMAQPSFCANFYDKILKLNLQKNMIFSSSVIDILFRNLTIEQKMISNKMLRIASASIVFHSLLQSVNGILIGKGRTYSILIGMGVGATVKILLNVLLLNNSNVNIYGAPISLIACYFTALLVNLILVIKKEKPNANKEPSNRQFSNWK